MTHSELHMIPSRAPSRSGLLQALLRLVVLSLSRENVEEDVSKSVQTEMVNDSMTRLWMQLHPFCVWDTYHHLPVPHKVWLTSTVHRSSLEMLG